MDIQKLKYFYEVYNCKSFSRAAENLFITQQGLSMAILRLEAELGTKFFIRSSRGLEVTKDGEFFAENAKIILERYELCEQHFSKESEADEVKIAACSGSMAEFAADAILAFQADHARFNIVAREYSDYECDKMVLNGNSDIGIGLAPLNEDSFEVIPLCERDMVLLVHESHPFAKESVVTPQMLEGESIVLMDERHKCGMSFKKTLSDMGINIKVPFWTGEISTVHRIVAENKAIGLTLKSVCDSMRTPNTIAIPFSEPLITWKACLFYMKGANLGKSAMTFANFLKDRYNK